jgi:hypothetical protein
VKLSSLYQAVQVPWDLPENQENRVFLDLKVSLVTVDFQDCGENEVKLVHVGFLVYQV